MLYIAEVKKQSKLFMGGIRTVLHLLACQQNDNRWSTLPGEETVTTDDVPQQFGEGALVTVNLGANRQVQGKVELAGEKVANWLQSFSRQVEKNKGQQEEIEQWKQSLSYQADELNRRQEELEQTEEQLAEKEEELSQLEQERAEIERLRKQWERDRADLERAWEQLRGEQQRLENQQTQLQGKQGLTPEQTQSLRDLVKQFEGGQFPSQALSNLKQFLNDRLKAIQGQWQTLDQEREKAEEKQKEAQKASNNLNSSRQDLKQKEKNLLEIQRHLVTVQSQLDTKQQIVTYLGTQLQKQSEARDVLSRLVINSPQLKIQQDVDTKSLEEMPMEQLETDFNSMQKSFEGAVSFVKEQEDELAYQLESVRELEEQLKQAGETEQESIKNELAEEQDRYRFLEKTLVGQRRNLMAREDVLEQYREILQRRQGSFDENAIPSKVDLSPIFNKIDSQRDYSEDEFHQVNDEIEELKGKIEELEEQVKQKQKDYDDACEKIKELESHWLALQKEANELSTRITVNGEILQEQDQDLQEIKKQVEQMTPEGNNGNSQGQQNSLSKVKELLSSLATS
ncbi:MAG: pilus motility taxis protein HmpF [Halothece sp.]